MRNVYLLRPCIDFKKIICDKFQSPHTFKHDVAALNHITAFYESASQCTDVVYMVTWPKLIALIG